MESQDAPGNKLLRVPVPPSFRTPDWGSGLPSLPQHLVQAFFTVLLPVFFFSRDAWGRPPPAAEVTGKLPPFDPCGPWVAGDRLRPLFPSLGCVLSLGVLPKYCLRRGSSFPVFQQVLTGDLGTPFSLQWVGGCGHQGPPETTPGLRAISGREP